MSPPSVKRLLIIEDNAQREQTLRSWLPPDFRPVVASSAGKAIGILDRDRGAVYAAVVLDHDLQERRVTEQDGVLCGQDVAETLMRCLSKEVPILVHSNNASQAPILFSRLCRAGFEVTQIPMEALTRERFEEWLRAVSQNWESISNEEE